MDAKRECIFKGHEGTKPQYICTFYDCEVGYRWVCSDCLIEQLHNHGQKKQDHIMKQQQFIDFAIKQFEQSKISMELQTLQELHKEIEQLIQSSIILKKSVMEFMKFTRYNMDHIINVLKKEYLLLDNTQLQSIIQMNNIKYDKKLSQSKIAVIEKQNQEINRLINMVNQEHNLLQSDESIIIIDKQWKESNQNQPIYQQLLKDKINQTQLQELKYDQTQFLEQKQEQKQFQPSEQKNFELYSASQNYHNYFEYRSDISILFSQISSDEQYLAIVGFDKKIQVFDLKTKQNTLCFYSQNQINICKFTLDSKYLLCTDDEGYLQQFDITKFKIINSIKIHENLVSDLIFINNHEIVTCSADKSIQIRNISSNQKIQSLQNAHKDFIYGIVYDFEKQIIFSCSKDNTIKLFYKNSGNLVFEQIIVDSYDIQQIQIIPDEEKLLSSSDSEIILWSIEYNKRQLIPIKVLSELNYNFTCALQNSSLVLICENQVKLLDNSLNLIKKIQHDIRDLYTYFRTVQLDSINYLVIVGFQQLQVLKKL